MRKTVLGYHVTFENGKAVRAVRKDENGHEVTGYIYKAMPAGWIRSAPSESALRSGLKNGTLIIR